MAKFSSIYYVTGTLTAWYFKTAAAIMQNVGNKPKQYPAKIKMSGKILNTVPISGEYPEVHFGDHFTQGVWVEFEDNDFQKWIGCFPKDYPNGFDKLLIDKDNNAAFVVAGGLGYLIDVNKRKLKDKTEEHPLIVSAILTENPGYFIAGTYHGVYVIDSNKIIKEVNPDMIIDGIYFKTQNGRKALGDLATAENQYDSNMDFEFDLETFELTLNQKVIRKNLGIFESVKVVDKNWTKPQNIFIRLINRLKK